MAHKQYLIGEHYRDSAVIQYSNWLDPAIHPELNGLLTKHGINGSIYTCRDLKKIANMFDELVDNVSMEAQEANNHSNMVSAVRHFIEHLLSVNSIII